jgi:ABC-type nitrate/sulfonate/bicarbonate transport system permease component
MNRRDLLGSILIVLLLWHIAALLLDRPILPTPFVVGGALLRELSNGNLPRHFLFSLWRVVASTTLAILLAVPAGLLLGQSARLNRLFAPMIYLLYPIPKVVLVPVVLLLFGFGDFPKIIIIFLILFFQILVLVRDQALGIRPEAGGRFFVLCIYQPVCRRF